MKAFIPIVSLILCTVILHSARCVLYEIKPHLSSSCTQQINCLTLSQFATQIDVNDSSVTLTFLPGNHSLPSSLAISDIEYVQITGNDDTMALDNQDVFIVCESQGDIRISRNTYVSIVGIKFIGCGNSVIDTVDHFSLEYSTFQDATVSGTALVLNSVINATISRSHFLTNTDGTSREDPTYFTTFSAGGAMIVSRSSLEITASMFQGNSAERGGVIYAERAAKIKIHDSSATFNRALRDGGGIVHLNSGCTAMITASNFSFNTGSVVTICDSALSVEDSIFSHNQGGVYVVNPKLCTLGASNSLHGNASLNITLSQFVNNSLAIDGAVINAVETSIMIKESNFTSNTANNGGVAFVQDCSMNISDCMFVENSALRSRGGAINSQTRLFGDRKTFITNSSFKRNRATLNGGAVYSDDAAIDIDLCVFQNNSAIFGGSIHMESGLDRNTNTTIANSVFSYHSETVMLTLGGGNSYNVDNCTFEFNTATTPNAIVIFVGYTTLRISDSTIHSNYNVRSILSRHSDIHFQGSNTFRNNYFSLSGGVLLIEEGSVTSDGTLMVTNNTARSSVVLLLNCPAMFSGNTNFVNNTGSLYAYGCTVAFYGETVFTGQRDSSTIDFPFSFGKDLQVGGAITSIFCTLMLHGSITMSGNEALSGGAMLVVATDLMLGSEGTVLISDNTASQNGGGISTFRSRLTLFGNCTLEGNRALHNGGGIHAVGSSLTLTLSDTSLVHSLALSHNQATKGGAIYFEANAHLNIRKLTNTATAVPLFVNITNNVAKYGGGFFVADETSTGVCNSTSSDIQTLGSDCFIQEIDAFEDRPGVKLHTRVLHMTNNSAQSGSNIFGGLLDRCTVSTAASLSVSGIKYGALETDMVSLILLDIDDIDSLESDPVRICFCLNNQPNCSYQHPAISVMRGHLVRVPVVAVDQVNHTVQATIISRVSSSGDLGEGQRFQEVGTNCTTLEFNIISSADSEQLDMHADGPCGDSVLSQTRVNISFLPCECLIGFEPSPDVQDRRCVCVCNSSISNRIGKCNASTGLVMKFNNSWIDYTNSTNPPGFIIHPYCPYDYCIPVSEGVFLNFNEGDEGIDVQCNFNRAGTLCGACRENYSLSLGSSLCLHCPSYWPALTFLTLLSFLLIGLILVLLLFVLNVTVATGTINGLLFYTNMVEANKTIYFTNVSFSSVFISLFNLEAGFNMCFAEELTALGKAWVEFLLPTYIIVLVVAIIALSEASQKFSHLIGKRNPIALLATLILLSYSRFLQNTIVALSFTMLQYPDGTIKMLWLPDATIGYFEKIRVPLFILATVILIVGVAYTLVLFSWQWIIQYCKPKIIHNHKLRSFIEAYTAPYNDRHRYWTGLLLFARVLLYLISAVNETGDPQIPLVSTTVITAGILLLKASLGGRVYKKWSIDITETILYFNLLFLSALTAYNIEKDQNKEIVAILSVVLAFLVLLAVVFYHLCTYVVYPYAKGRVSCLKSRDSQAQNNDQSIVKTVRHPSAMSDANDRFRDLEYVFDSPSAASESSSFEIEQVVVAPTSNILEPPLPQDM